MSGIIINKRSFPRRDTPSHLDSGLNVASRTGHPIDYSYFSPRRDVWRDSFVEGKLRSRWKNANPNAFQDYLLFMHLACCNRANRPATPPGTWLCGRRGRWGWGRDPAPSFQRPLRRSLFLTRRELTPRRGNSRLWEGKK